MTSCPFRCGRTTVFLVAGALLGALSFPVGLGFRAGDVVLGVMAFAVLVFRGWQATLPEWFKVYLPVVFLLCG